MKDFIQQKVNTVMPELVTMSKEIYDHPELGHEEYLACELHTGLLNKYGFAVEKNYLGIKTAFKATYCSGKQGPTIAFLAEYDALPSVGHGCGHNILGTVSTGAGIILKQMMEGLGGTVLVFGTPAEETSGAKVDMAEQGCFEGVDIALVVHPENRYCKSGKSLAMEALQFEFFGQSAHAATSPEKGVNALDAVIGLFNHVNALRQHIRSDARVHGIINNGGLAPNVVPDYASAKFYVRATTKTYLDELVKRIKNCGEGAALATGAKIKISNYEASYHNLVTNETLSEVFCSKLMEAGCTKIHEPRASFGSLDAGNVSQVCPMIHPYFDITGDMTTIAHTKEFAEASIKEYALQQMGITIQALVATAVAVIEDEDLLGNIKKEFIETEK